MKIIFSTSSISTVVKHNLKFILYACYVLLAAWLLFFAYQNLYSSIIAPEKIDKSEIIAKRQKVNIELFNLITANINEKATNSAQAINTIPDPFD